MTARRVISDLLESGNALSDFIKDGLDEAVCDLSTCKEALKAAQPIQYPTNIELVTKYFDKLDAVLQ